MPTDRLSTGIGSLDAVLGGLIPGDNVVWFGGGVDLHRALQAALVSAAPSGTPTVLVTTLEAPDAVRRRLRQGTEVLDARPGERFADPATLERAVIERGAGGAWIIIDGLDDFVRRLRPEGALLLFSRICPELFDLGAVCYWRAGDGSRSIRDGVRAVTQCVFDVGDDRLRLDKAEGRPGVQGRIYRLTLTDGVVEVDQERARGRVAEGLRQLRAARRLTQSDVARIAGVSPSAISQAESGHRGLGLDTLMAIAEGFGVKLDDLVGAVSSPGYVIARRDRTPPRRGTTPLLDDPATGLRSYLVQLGPGEEGEPQEAHKGPELIVVGAGLVQVKLGSESCVMRAGDAALATTVAVHGWRNLHRGPSRFFWVLRDPLPRDA